MVDVNNHDDRHTILAAFGRETKVDLEDCVPDLLLLGSAVVPDRGLICPFAYTDRMVAVIRSG